MTASSAFPARTWPALSARPSSSAGTTAIPISPTSIRRSAAADAVVVGNGNVALDCARILSKTRNEFQGSDIVGHALDALEARRSAPSRFSAGAAASDRHDTQGTWRARPSRSRSARRRAADFPPVEADEALEPGLRKSVSLLRGFAEPTRPAKPKRIVFDFFAKPRRDRRRRQGRADRGRAHRARRKRRAREARARPMKCRRPWSSARSAIRHRRSTASRSKAASSSTTSGRIADRLYAVGWARRGPTGTIGTNRPDGYEVADQIAADMPAGKLRRPPGRGGPQAPARSARSHGDRLRRLAQDRGNRDRQRAARLARARSSSAHERLAGWRRPLAPLAACAQPPSIWPRALAPAATPVASAGSGRGVAQPGRALSSGGRGRRFKSSLPDQLRRRPADSGMHSTA